MPVFHVSASLHRVGDVERYKISLQSRFSAIEAAFCDGSVIFDGVATMFSGVREVASHIRLLRFSYTLAAWSVRSSNAVEYSLRITSLVFAESTDCERF